MQYGSEDPGDKKNNTRPHDHARGRILRTPSSGDLHRCIYGVRSRRVPGGSAGRVSSSPCGPAGSDGEQFDERDHCRNPPLPSNISRSDVERPIAAMPASASPNAPDHRRGRLVGGKLDRNCEQQRAPALATSLLPNGLDLRRSSNSPTGASRP